MGVTGRRCDNTKLEEKDDNDKDNILIIKPKVKIVVKNLIFNLLYTVLLLENNYYAFIKSF